MTPVKRWVRKWKFGTKPPVFPGGLICCVSTSRLCPQSCLYISGSWTHGAVPDNRAPWHSSIMKPISTIHPVLNGCEVQSTFCLQTAALVINPVFVHIFQCKNAWCFCFFKCALQMIYLFVCLECYRIDLSDVVLFPDIRNFPPIAGKHEICPIVLFAL